MKTATSVPIPDLTVSLKALNAVPFAKHETYAKYDWSSVLPRSSRAFTTNVMKHTASQRDPISLVVTAHLYLDYILNRLIARGGLSVKDSESYSRKVQVLERRGDLNPQFAARFMIVNALRNRFAHDLHFDMALWDPFQDDWISTHITRRPRQPKHRRNLNLILFRLFVLKLVFDYTDEYSWLSFEDLPSDNVPK